VIKVPTAGIEIEATLTVPPIAGRTTPWQALNALYKSDTLELFAGVPTPPAMEVVAKLQCWRAVLTLDIIAEISLQRIVFPVVNAIINLQIYSSTKPASSLKLAVNTGTTIPLLS
jgi:hypothetical protein